MLTGILFAALITTSSFNSTPAQVHPHTYIVGAGVNTPAIVQLDQKPGAGVLTLGQPVPDEVRKRKLWVTAYSSSVDETDSTPFTTASGSHVRDGIVATNLLLMGTKVRIPALFGQKVFVVEDRMARRKTNHLDIWMPSKEAALRFGVAYVEIEILKDLAKSGEEVALVPAVTTE